MNRLFKTLIFVFLVWYAPVVALSLVDIKGLMLQRISSFITWPQLPDEKIKICVIGNDYFAQHLQKLYQTKKLHGRSLSVVSAGTKVEKEVLKSCQIIYVANTNKDILGEISQVLKNNSTLIIGSNTENIYDGVSIVLYLEGSRYKIMINQTKLTDMQLKADYRLLKLAKIVEQDRGDL